jgi:hypothetical protein
VVVVGGRLSVRGNGHVVVGLPSYYRVVHVLCGVASWWSRVGPPEWAVVGRCRGCVVRSSVIVGVGWWRWAIRVGGCRKRRTIPRIVHRFSAMSLDASHQLLLPSYINLGYLSKKHLISEWALVHWVVYQRSSLPKMVSMKRRHM